jgi:hypothetical protein
MLKIKKVWEEYKVPIIIVGGICATVVGYKTYGKLNKTILTDKGVEFKDALVTILDGRKIFFVR